MNPVREGRQAALPLDELDDPDEREDELAPDFDDPEPEPPEFEDPEFEDPEFEDPELEDPEPEDPEFEDLEPDSDLAGAPDEDDPFAAAAAGVFESDELDEPLEESELPAEPAVDAEELSLPFARESVR